MVKRLPLNHQLNLHSTYFLLAGFNILAIVLSSHLNQQLVSNYNQSIILSQVWYQRLEAYDQLSRIAIRANAPGNNIFISQSVSEERKNLNEALKAFAAQQDQIKANLASMQDKEQAQILLSQLDAIATEFQLMVDDANAILMDFDQGKIATASQKMAEMDQRSHQIGERFSELNNIVFAIQNDNYTQQSLIVTQLKYYEFILLILSLSIILSVTWYGIKLSQKMAQDSREEAKILTQLQQAEIELTQQKQDLESTLSLLKKTQGQVIQNEKLSSLGQLVAGIAHEINNPANFIHGNLIHATTYTQELLTVVDLYQQDGVALAPNTLAQIEEYDLDFIRQDLPALLQSMQVGSTRIRDIVTSLRNFSRLDESEFKQVDVHEGLDSTLLILNHRLKATPDHPHITVQKDYAATRCIDCYPGPLNQVFMNVLSNAIDAVEEYRETVTEPDGRGVITIKTGQVSEQSILIQIADDGTGIEAAIAAKIFEPFFTTKVIGQGTGLGLSIAHSIIVKQHQGELRCESTPGQGTTFTLVLPIHQQRPPVPQSRVE
jgi:signal transduction histidine kinase